MVILTGDTHRDFCRIFDFCAKFETTSDDVLVILGDVGINYFLDNTDYDLKRELSRLEVILLCVHGNHEERPFMIPGYEEKEWHGGTVYCEPEFPNLLFAKDGEIYDLEVRKTLVIGGAYSVDKYWRLSNGARWFSTEKPSEEIMDDVERALDRAHWRVDVVLSHTAPLKYVPMEEFLPTVDQALVDKSSERWLDSIESRLDYDHWYLGHYHCERREAKVSILFEEFVEL